MATESGHWDSGQWTVDSNAAEKRKFFKMYNDNLFILALGNGRIVKVEEVFIPQVQVLP
jgi:hypothetical protein